jgi:tryptophanyl-tRNA synthetase
MTQFKDKSKKHNTNINSGLFTYPVLMASDILLYDTNFVPVGEDQKQHVEICRDIALRFNNLYGEDSFKIPEPYITSSGARIMDLQDPSKKMSKSNLNSNHLGVISILDSPQDINNKIKKAITDSENQIKFSNHKPAINNLLNIFCAIKNLDQDSCESYFKNKNYGELKKILSQEIINLLTPIQDKYHELSRKENQDYINQLILSGQQKASELAQKKLKLIKNKIGFCF